MTTIDYRINGVRRRLFQRVSFKRTIYLDDKIVATQFVHRNRVLRKLYATCFTWWLFHFRRLKRQKLNLKLN